ncbi:polycystic kidney disease protein 1-like [Mactra antiquata]
MRAERNEALDVSEPLSYRAVQYFLDAAGQINESIDPFKLAPSANGEKCFTLANPPNGIKRTQIKVFIYDALNQHVEEDLGQFDVEGPVPDGTVGEEAATIVQEFATLQLQKMNDLDSIGDASTISELAATAVTALPAAPKVERNTQNVDEIPLDKQIVFDMPDGKPLSSEDLADDLKQKEEPPEARAIEEATANVTRKFKESLEKEASGVALSAGTAQRYAQALSALASGKKENFNKNSLDNVVSLSETVFAMMNNEASDPSSDDDVTNDMLVMIKKVGSTVAPEDAVEPSDEKSLHQADKLAEHFASAETLEKREQSRTKKLARNTETFSRTVTEKATLVDGTAASYGGNGAQIDIVQDSGNLLSQKTMKGGAASFKVPSLASTKSSVRTSILTTETVMKLNEDGSDNGVTSDQYTIAISTNENLDGGSPTQITMPAKMPPPSLITLNPNEDDASGFGTYMETTCEKGSDIVLVFDNDVEVYIRCDGSGNENKVSVINYDAKQIVVEGQVHFTQDEIACNLDDPICSVGIKSNSNEQTSSGGRTRRSTEEQTMNVTVLSLACKTFDDSTNTWRTDECKGKLNPITEEIDCSCIPKKELTVANSFYVPPNMIDFSSVFLKFSPLNQAAVMSVLILILIIYVIIVIWARRQDRKDLLKWGITPMSDNFSEDNYFYVIKVFTGMRPGAGTRSRVSMVIAGEEMDTGVRELADGVREEFGTGSVMNFLMSASSYLGDLDYIRVWHDNSGSGNFSSWYLSKIEVHDIQRNEMFVFLAERWLAVEQDDGLLECVLPVCKNENLNKFKNRFFLNAKDNLAESHIWVSVAYRPQASNFTRVQRASVALLFVMLTMIANAMFFKTSDEGNYETPSELQVGPFRFSLKQVYTSIICALIVTPPTIIVIYLFKLAKNKIKPNEKLFKPRHRGNGYKVPFMSSWLEEEQKRSMELERHLVTKGIPTNEGFRFPHAVVYIAWLLVISGSVLSAFFVMLYSMEWGKQKSEEWVTTFLLSFVESVFCLDPIKVGIMALVFALIFRSTQNSETPVDRGTIMKNYSTSLRGKSGGVRLPAPPLDSKKLENARSVRQRELLMKTAFRDIIINVVMIWILFSISYSNRDTRSYDMLQEVHNQLLDPINLPQFTKIKSINEYFDWLRNTAIVNMFPETEIDGNRTELHWRVRQFIQGGVLFRVGPPRLRQLRTTKKKCKNPYFGEEDCFKKYVQTSEDTEDYCLGWKHEPCSEEEQIYKFSYDAWKFTSALDIWGLPITGFYTTYGGGGYIAKLDVNREISNYILDELYNNSWVDRQTRSVLFEFTLYCLNANIFTYNMFMVEFPETGGAIPFYNIFPLTIYQHIGPMGMYTLLCEVIFAFYQLVCTICIIVMIVQQKKEFFKKPWQVYDFIFTILGYVAIIMYVIRYVFVNMSLDIFREDKRQFVNFYHIAIWNQSFVLLIGVLVFMATLRMLNILGYNKRISALARVFTEAANELIWFGIFFLYVFTCYSAFGYLLFGSKLKSYMNVFKAMGTLFISMIGKSRFTEIDNTDPIMSKIYFVIFIFFVVYMILTMFLAILSKAIDQVHAEAKKDKGDEMVDYVIKKVTGYLSYGSRSKKSTVNPIKAQYRTTSAKKKKFHVDSSAKMDHREILQEIRMTMNDAITTNPRDFTTPCDEKQEKKVKFRR